MNRCLLFLCFLLIFQSFLSAQTAIEIEELLNTPSVSYGQAARFVLKAADSADSSGQEGFFSPAEAFSFAAERAWLPGEAASNGEASLEGISLLIMRSFDMKGGLFYSVFKNSHYAYRELVYKDIIQGKTEPGMAVSGETLLFLVNRVLSCMESITPAPAAEGKAGAELSTEKQQ